MNIKKNCCRALLALFTVTLFSFHSLAQSETRPVQDQPSYDVALHLVIGSNDGTRAELPGNLSGVLKQIKSSFSFSNYRVASTFVGRVANAGSFEYKSVGSIFGRDSETNPQSFLDWSLVNLRGVSGSKGQPGFQANAFRFGARVPVPVGGAGGPTYNYESIGLSLNRAGLAENVPTLIGTLNLPGAGGVIFLVMTVKSADM